MIGDPRKKVQTDEACPRCKLAFLWKIEGDDDGIYLVDHLGCTNCNYQENREQEIVPFGNMGKEVEL